MILNVKCEDAHTGQGNPPCVPQTWHHRFVAIDVESDRRLLADVFPHDSKFSNSAFLKWQYLGSPSGVVIAANHDDEIGRIGHYAVLPQRWLIAGVAAPMALSLNTAVAERGRGQGLFTKLATATFDLAMNAGVEGIIGVANAQSTPGFLGKLGFTLVGPLEVSILLPRPMPRGDQVTRIDLSELGADVIGRFQPSVSEVARVWDAAELNWRLGDPGRTFTVFVGDRLLAVTCATKQHGIPVAVILKVLTAPGAVGIELGKLVNAACRHHRAPFALHAGTHQALVVKGIGLPQRLKPSPLNLIVKSLNSARPATDFVPTTFEFLEFDAY